ncbi:hypothetical protein [Luteolibacter luteus]|uniref:Uncharacterized protein n=1 Tax=Luteolibacter luteus TaxID=2728835 RepID=A0A858RD29_9BACT|nr:hypothetical protein [Luteolibacter luteus]QJE94299.1 hypothetical protein HHL09_00360 [Luteolibacter luteus]
MNSSLFRRFLTSLLLVASGLSAHASNALAGVPSSFGFQAVSETALLGSPVSGAAGAVGPAHVFSMQETEVHVQTKDGASVLRQKLDVWWQALNPAFAAADVSQPHVIYDSSSQRWIAIAAARVVPDSAWDARTFALLVAVSQGSDPTGAWRSWRFDMAAIGSSTFTPSIQSLTLGYNKKWIAVGAFVLDTNYRTSVHRTLVFPKAAALAGQAIVPRIFEDDASTSITPVQTFDANEERLYLVQSWNSNVKGSGYLRVTAIQGAVGAESLVEVGYPKAPAWAANDNDTDSFYGNAPQLGGTDLIATYDDRVQTAVFRDGSLWVAQTVFLPAANPNRSSVQWWRVAASSAEVQQRGLIDDETGARSHAFPSLAVNGDEEIFIGYNAFSATSYAGAYGKMFVPSNGGGYAPMPEVVIKSGEAYFLKHAQVNPWGPNTVSCLDPSDGDRFWSLQQYSVPLADTTGAWATWWGTASAPNLSVNSLDAWRAFHELPGDGALDLDSGSDQVSNLVKYALNIAPNSGDLTRSGAVPLANPDGTTLAELSGLPAARKESSGRFSLTYLRRKAVNSPGVSYQVQFSDTPGRWVTNPAATEHVLSIDPIWERVKVTDSFSVAEKKSRFLQLKVNVSEEFSGGF